MRGAAQAAVADAILRAVSWEAEVSLEASLALLEALARDLQADFLAHLPRAMSALADVLDEGAPARCAAGKWAGAAWDRICKGASCTSLHPTMTPFTPLPSCGLRSAAAGSQGGMCVRGRRVLAPGRAAGGRPAAAARTQKGNGSSGMPRN